MKEFDLSRLHPKPYRRRVYLVDAVKAKKDMVFEHLGEQMEVLKGDYIARDASGKLFVVHYEDFEKEFESLTQIK